MPGCIVRPDHAVRCARKWTQAESRAAFRAHRRLSCRLVRSFSTSSRQHAGYSSIDEEHATLIDPSSLRKSLEAIRASNRTRLIRKVDQEGKTVERLSLPQILRDDINSGDAQREDIGDDSTKVAAQPPIPFRKVDPRDKFHVRRSPPKRRVALVPGNGKPKVESAGSAIKALATEDLDGNSERAQRQKGDAFKSPRKPPVAPYQSGSERTAPPRRDGTQNTRVGEVANILPEWQPRGVHPVQQKYPWVMHMDEESRTKVVPATERLEAEIASFERFFTPTEAEDQLTQQLMRELQKTLDDSGFEFTAELIGSRANGLASPLSDLDINLIPKGQARPDVLADREFSQKQLARLRRILKPRRMTDNHNNIHALQSVPHARVPILKAFHPLSGLEIQFQMSNQGFNTTTYAKSFVREFPSLRAVFLILRQFLTIRGLNHGFAGGLTSYPLLNMVVAAMHSQESEGQFSGELAADFMYVLTFWTDLDLSKHGVAVTPFEIVPLDTKRRWNGRMYLRDPADPSHDLGISSSRILDVQASLQQARRNLSRKMAAWDHHAASGVEHIDLNDKEGAPLLGAFLLGDYKQFLMERSLLTCQKMGWRRLNLNDLGSVAPLPSSNEQGSDSTEA
jgi:hypothetical protein